MFPKRHIRKKILRRKPFLWGQPNGGGDTIQDALKVDGDADGDAAFLV